ncbi:MAG: hypothetical protein IH943_11325 [Acidobacteria bacterium]|nr:hypothetical protein [Acidobacteriota bacterium]
MKPSWGKAALTLAAGGSNTEAAKAAGVNVRTVARWRADEVSFADRIEALRSEMLTEAAGLLAATTTAAARRLAEIVKSEEERHSLTAARIILDQASRYKNDQALEDRIAALELAVNVRTVWP